MKRKVTKLSSLMLLLSVLAGCSFNPFNPSGNDATGSPVGALIGAGVGGETAALLGGTKVPIITGGLIGGAVGYYVTTLRFASGGVLQTGGQVYKLGDVVSIYIPTDQIFEVNTADFTWDARPVLDSAAAIIQRYPNNNIIISGNTSGFGRPKREQVLSEKRAAKVAGYLWSAGITSFKDPGNEMRKLEFVGYGDYFPIASTLHNKGVRENSRIQIISYPSNCDLGLDRHHMAFRNVGALNDDSINEADPVRCPNGNCVD